MTAIIPYLIIAGLGAGGFFWIKGLIGKNKELKTENKKLHHEIAEEIRRNQEREKQITDLLEFQSNDSEIEKEMNEHVKILRKAGSNDNVKEELKKVSNTIRNIYRS